MFVDFDTIFIFVGLDMEADILARRDGRDAAVRRPRFCSQLHCSNFPNSLVYRKFENQHFHSKLSFCRGFEEAAWGKMSVSTVGSSQVFIIHVTLTCNLQFKVHVFPKTSIFIFSV